MAESDQESETRTGEGTDAGSQAASETQAEAEALEAMAAAADAGPQTPTEKLSHVIDDTDGREEAVKWTENQLLTGASFEVVTAELVSQGWPEPSAIAIVEEAREATRRSRGIRTREDVVIGVYRKFGKTMRRVRWLIIIGIIIVVVAISMMLNQG